MKLKPLHDWAVIKRSEAEERSPGGIIIPDSVKDRPSEGIVVSIGAGSYKKIKGKERFIPTTLQSGQRVAYSKYMAQEVEVGGERFTLVREDDILGTFEGERKTVRKEPEQQEKPVVTKGMKKSMSAVSQMKERSGKERATRKKAVRKSAKTEGEKKTKKKTLTKSATTKSGPKALKKPVAKKTGDTPSKGKVTKRNAGTKKASGRKSPLKSKTARKKKQGSSPAGRGKKSQPQRSRKKTVRG